MTTTTAGLLQLAFYICLIAAAQVPLGAYMARIAQSHPQVVITEPGMGYRLGASVLDG